MKFCLTLKKGKSTINSGLSGKITSSQEAKTTTLIGIKGSLEIIRVVPIVQSILRISKNCLVLKVGILPFLRICLAEMEGSEGALVWEGSGSATKIDRKGKGFGPTMACYTLADKGILLNL